MVGFVRSLPGRLGRGIRRRPRVTVLVVGAALLAGVGTFYAYAVWEWRQAVTAVRQGRSADARRRLRLCLAVWPKDAAVHRLAARAAWQTGDHVAAEEHLNTCLRLEGAASEDTQLEFLLIRAQTGEADEVASLLFDYVARGHPDSTLILQTVALAYMHDLRYGPAYACLNRWIKVSPDSARAYYFRGWVLERMNQPGQAQADYLRALELDPGLDVARLRVAEMYLEDKEVLQALPHLEVLRKHDPDRAEFQARLGQCRYLQGRHEEARQLLEGVADRMPDDGPVRLFLARLDIDDQQPARAEGRLRKVLELEPSDVEARFVLVTALRLQGREAEAAAELAEYDQQKAGLERANHLLQDEAKAPSRDPQVAFEIGALLLRIRRDVQGLYWLNEALARDPGHQPTHRALAEYFEKAGDHDRAAVHRRQLHQ